jgi:pimeloyl-ACP methyl ester carboxylesterase
MFKAAIKFISSPGLLACLIAAQNVIAGGEAGPIHLRDQGHFYVGIRQFEIPANPDAGRFGLAGVGVYGQMYVGYQLPEQRTQKYPLILVHGGGGQATDWMGTPDGRDGWLDYFLAAGFDVYFVDRPGYGRSPNSTRYGKLDDPASSGFIGFLANSDNYPGKGDPRDPMTLAHLASSNPGPTVGNDMLKENFAELLDKVGPAIVLTQSAGGPSGWMSIDARPELVKAVVAIEGAGGLERLPLTWEPALKEGESIQTVAAGPKSEGLAACNMQPEDNVRKLPHFKGIPILGIVSSQSPMFTPSYHCTIDFINQAGGNATLLRLKEDAGMDGEGHFMQGSYNNGRIAKLMIEWMQKIE